MKSIAIWVDNVSSSRVTPNHITIASLLLHIPIFLAIISQLYFLAAIMIVVFGLMDSVDGELARIQKRESKAGMLLDASSDRAKEALIFMALAYRFALDNEPQAVLATVAAITGAFAVSYIKAKGETAMKDSHLSVQEINKIFQSGLMRYEIRMALLVIGLIFSSLLIPTMWLLGTLAWLTAFYRLVVISDKIS